MSRFSKKSVLTKIAFSKATSWAHYGTCMKNPTIKWPINFHIYIIFLFWCVLLFFITVVIESSLMDQSRYQKYLNFFKWKPITLSVGFAVIGYHQYKHIRKREAVKLRQVEPCEALADVWEVEAYKLLPLRTVSRVWGWMTGIDLPEWSRRRILGSYVRAFNCNMAEAEIEDLDKYKNLSEFFRRKLKSNVRPIDVTCGVVSPADGTVLSKGKVSCGVIEQVKGVTYSAKRFLGPNCWSERGPVIIEKNDDLCFHNSCLQNPRKNDLHQVVIYLAPGDYHRFHSPVDWAVFFRRHFPGELLSVNPSIASWIRDLFVLNERVCYVGSWKWGFFSMTAVGATNVGSIVVPFDSTLKTNNKHWKKDKFFDIYFNDIPMKKGEDFGEFNLGSTIVLLFEAPKNSSLNVEVGQKVFMGQPLIHCAQ